MMEFKDLLAQSMEEEKAETENELPDWVSEDNASLAAYNAINNIKKEKYSYISKHKTTTKFRVAKTFQVQKSEVAEKIGATTQALFYASSYSEKLLEYLEGKEDQEGVRKGGVNGVLMKRKNERIAKPRTGLASKSKKEVYAKAQTANSRIKELEAQIAADQLTLAIEKLPMNVRDKLKLT
jgi:hypothetical protein